MEELIKVQVKNDHQLVGARDLYKGLEVKRRIYKIRLIETQKMLLLPKPSDTAITQSKSEN